MLFCYDTEGHARNRFVTTSLPATPSAKFPSKEGERGKVLFFWIGYHCFYVHGHLEERSKGSQQ